MPRWDAFVDSSATPFPLQLSAWAQAKQHTGWTSLRVVADGGSGPIGGQVLMRRLRPGPFSLGYVPRGPVATSFDEVSLAAFGAALREVAKSRRLTHVTAEPGLEGTAHHALFRAAGWKPAQALQPPTSQIIDLRKTEEELWSDVYKSSRRYANGARKRGCTVREGGQEDLPVFYDILVETAHRSGWIPRALEAYGDVYRAFAEQGRARILIGSLPDGTAVSSKLILRCGGTDFQFYGGLTDSGGKERSGHFFEWEAIIRSKAAGASFFDMWGRSTKGIAHFKQGFGGRVVEYGGAWDLVANPTVRALSVRGRAAMVWLARRRHGLGSNDDATPAPGSD